MMGAIITPAAAKSLLDDQDCLFVDCRYVMAEPGRGERDYREGHIPGAVFANMDTDLASHPVQGVTGRHPLPAPAALTETFSRWGIGETTRVIAYDEVTGAMAAARLWWLLKWAGHDEVAVLEGGLQGWKAAGLPVSSSAVARTARAFTPSFRPGMAVDAARVQEVLADPAFVVLDARSAERYRGENETVDPAAGHIRGALSAPYAENMAADGTFEAIGELQGKLGGLAGNRDAEHTVVYCGSGVTAAHLALAFAHAGKGIPRLYSGSWSDWITDPRRPTARG
jgi:thiosulfate/3-mercaptopyruvate sulfurtransferase